MTVPVLQCEAGGCTAVIFALHPDGPKDEPPGWTFYRVPPGWAVTQVIGDGKSVPAANRMVVLCPLHASPAGSAAHP